MSFTSTTYVSAALTADGTANGVVTIADTSLFRKGTEVFLKSNAVANVQLVVDEILSATTLAVKLPYGYQYSRFDCSAYLVADSAKITQPAQPDFVESDDVTEFGGSIDVTGNITATGFGSFGGTLTASNLSGTNTGDLTLAAFGATPDAKGAILTGQSLALQPADGTHPGLVSIAAQVFAGEKDFVNGLKTNLIESHSASTISMNGSPTDGATAVGVTIGSATTLANAAAKLVSIKNNAVEKAYFAYDGSLSSPMMVLPGGQKITNGAAIPVAGTWAVGDIVFNTSPVAGGTIGWVCVVAGAPGSWKDFGPVSV